MPFVVIPGFLVSVGVLPVTVLMQGEGPGWGVGCGCIRGSASARRAIEASSMLMYLVDRVLRSAKVAGASELVNQRRTLSQSICNGVYGYRRVEIFDLEVLLKEPTHERS